MEIPTFIYYKFKPNAGRYSSPMERLGKVEGSYHFGGSVFFSDFTNIMAGQPTPREVSP